MPHEMFVDHLYLRLDGRVFEILSDQSDYEKRIHVDMLAVAVKGPGRDGRYRLHIGMGRAGEEPNPGMGRVGVSVDEEEFQRFSRLLALARAARDAGPEPF